MAPNKKTGAKDNRNRRVLFLYSGSIMPWMERDLRILQKHFEVSILSDKLPGLLGKTKGRMPGILYYSLGGMLNLPALFREISHTGVIFGWFVSRFVAVGLLFSKLLRKKSIVVVGGYDIENIPEIEYGDMRYGGLRRFVSFSLRQADLVLPFSEYAAEKVKILTKDGAKIHVANLACDTERFSPRFLKENVVITTGFIDRRYIMRKGFKTFVEAARYLPDVRFCLIGRQRDEAVVELKAIATPNVEFPGYLPDDELLAMYQRAKVFCLLSYQEGEGGGGVLGEAMACGCIPVISEKAVALRETAGECGYYVPYGNPQATAAAIRKALESPPEMGERARKRIVELYSTERRERDLLSTIDTVVKPSRW